jgi:hypothetical protein
MAATILRSALVAHGFGTSDTPVAIVVVPSGADAFNLNADAYLRRASLRLGANGDALKPVWHRLPPTSLKRPTPATEDETQETQEPANATAAQRPTAEERSMKAAEDREAVARRRTEAMSGRGFESAYRAHFKENAENKPAVIAALIPSGAEALFVPAALPDALGAAAESDWLRTVVDLVESVTGLAPHVITAADVTPTFTSTAANEADGESELATKYTSLRDAVQQYQPPPPPPPLQPQQEQQPQEEQQQQQPQPEEQQPEPQQQAQQEPQTEDLQRKRDEPQAAEPQQPPQESQQQQPAEQQQRQNEEPQHLPQHAQDTPQEPVEPQQQAEQQPEQPRQEQAHQEQPQQQQQQETQQQEIPLQQTPTEPQQQQQATEQSPQQPQQAEQQPQQEPQAQA